MPIKYIHVYRSSFAPGHTVNTGMKQPGEAAAMYELGGQEDRAAAIYVAGKDLDKAALVMPRVTLPKLLGQYAKACEITGRYEGGAVSAKHGCSRPPLPHRPPHARSTAYSVQIVWSAQFATFRPFCSSTSAGYYIAILALLVTLNT